jgi:hypothetical protein
MSIKYNDHNIALMAEQQAEQPAYDGETLRHEGIFIRVAGLLQRICSVRSLTF